MVKNIENKLILNILVILSVRNIVLTAKAKFECGYKQCPQTREGALNVHLIPHSHMDAGWVKTFDEYYFGTRSTVSTANVQLIYHSVVTELLHDKRRKFTFSETAFFWRWWKEQRPQTRATFRNLVQEGRIEFAGGGWVQNDEATPDYLQIIDQFTWGLRKLNDTLGPCGKPKAAWQIDTYGHTREQVSLLAQMGYDGLFIGRVDHKAREAMIDEDRMEFMWRGSDTLGKMSDIMTHTLYNLYNAPNGFCFDFLCSDEPIVDDPDDRVYNADTRVNDFISHIERQAKYYDHDNINVMMGGDFTYQSAANWFMNMDKLINHVTTHPANLSDINIFYSTPSCYLKAIYLYGRRDKALYTEKADHLPYGSDVNTYWTGYYTSRPSLKYLARIAHKFLQVMKQVTVLARSGDSYELHLLRHAAGLVLHHDGITGTSQQHVANDFIRIICEAIDVSVKKTSNLLSNLTPTWGGSRRSKNNQLFTVCLQLNMSQCEFMESQESMILLVYNPLSVKTYFYVRLPAIALHYSIRDSNDEEVEYQLLPLPPAVTSLPGRSSQAIQELTFEAENIPPLGFTAYYIASIRDQLEENEYAKRSHSNHPDESELVPYISNEYIKVSVNKETGLLQSIEHMDGVRIDMSQNFYFYGQNETAAHSGAYSFRPEKNRPTPVTERVVYHTVRGPLVKEIRQRFSDWVSQVIRLYRGEEFIELEWVVGAVPVASDLGKEVVTVFSTNITNKGEFLVDANSKQIMKRSCWNETSSHQQKKPVAACYSPVTSRICIRSLNSSVEMCVLPDRPQGATSYNEGEIELMVHRRLLTDDDFGLEETLNEEAYGAGLIVKGKHRIIVGNYKQDLEGLTFSERASQAARRYNNEPWLFFTSGERINRRKWQNVKNKRYSALRVHGLPRHVQVLTLEPWKAGSVLLRLENTLEKPVRARTARDKSDGQGEVLRSSYLTVDLRKIFLYHQVRAVRETTLAANQWMDDARQMDWSTRYVYNGGDDGVLPEDNIDYKDDPKASPNDSAPDYGEDTGYRRKKQSKPKDRSRQNTKSPRQFSYDNRKKRSLNKTVIIDKNIVNETLGNITRDTSAKKTRNTYSMGGVYKIDEAPKLIVGKAAPEIVNNKFSNVTRAEIDCGTKKGAARYSTVTRKTPKGILNGRTKTLRYGDSNKNSDEVGSDEDFSYNSRKRARRRNSRRNAKSSRHIDIHRDATDDGVTKSIYEMYYKNLKWRPIAVTTPVVAEQYREGKIRRRNTKFRRIDRNSQEDDSASYETSARKNKYRSRDLGAERSERERKIDGYRADESADSEERRRVTLRGRNRVRSCGEDMAPKSELSQLRAKRRREDPEDEYEMVAFDASDESERDGDTTAYGRRSKRMIAKQEEMQGEAGSPEPSELSDQDYVVTLRPTQIRTFVVWFDEKKNS